MAIISQVLQEGRDQCNSGLAGATACINVPATRGQPSLLPRGIWPFSKELPDENMEGKLTAQRMLFCESPDHSFFPNISGDQRLRRSGPEGLPWKRLLVLSYTSTKWSFDGTQSCGIKRFTVSRQQ